MKEGNVIPLTPVQRDALEPYRVAVAQAQAALGNAFGMLVTGAGVDLNTHTAQLTEDGAGYVVRPVEPVGESPGAD